MDDNFIWRVKQLFPLTYQMDYYEKGEHHFVVWKMWLGKNYKIDYVIMK